jgi:hypothetical protein
MIRTGLIGLAALAAAGVMAAEADVERLDAAQALWQAAAADDYRYAYEKYCECYRDAQPQTVVTVTDGAIERVHHLHEDSDREVPARDGSVDLYWTIDDLFAKLAGAYAGEAVVRVEYDAELGYPLTLFIDYDTGFVGDETDIRLTRFELR